ncbi:hypothetical protein PINS_up005316 [Pythium insidiosum]|nr:hypothetical protein PINS_up005316 [Pythium insidiosum]
MSAPLELHDTQRLASEAPEEQHDDDVSTERTWLRFRRRQRRRQLLLQDPASDSSRRWSVLSGSDAPWHVFGKTRRDEYWQWIHDISGLHFSRLHQACADGELRVVQQLLLTQTCTLERDSSGRLPLHHAVIRERHDAVRCLMRRGDARLQLHATDNARWTPLHYALDKMRRIALKAFPGVAPARMATRLRARNQRFRRLWRTTDLMLGLIRSEACSDRWKAVRHLDEIVRGDAWDAVATGDVERLRFVLQRYCDDVPPSGDQQQLPYLDELQRTLLHEACHSRLQSLPVVHCLLAEFPCERDARDCASSTALHYAAAQSWFEACSMLLDDSIGSDTIDVDAVLTARDAGGRSPLHCCLYFARRALVVNAPSSLDSTRVVAIYLAKLCPLALHIVDYLGFSPLHYAVDLGDHELVLAFLELGAPVVIPDSVSRSPAHLPTNAAKNACK